MGDGLTHYERFTRVFFHRGLNQRLVVRDALQDFQKAGGLPAGLKYRRVAQVAKQLGFPRLDSAENPQAFWQATAAYYLETMFRALEHKDRETEAFFDQGLFAEMAAIHLEATKIGLAQCGDHYSLAELLHTEGYQSFLEGLAQVFKDRAAVLTGVQQNYHMAAHEMAGKRVYSVGTDLARRLAETELRGLRTEDLKLPYEAIYILAPEGLDLKVWNVETGWHPLEGVYVSVDSRMPQEIGERNMGDVPGWRLLFVGREQPETAPNSLYSKVYNGIANDALSFFRVALPAGKKVEDCIDLVDKEMRWTLQNHRTAQWSEEACEVWPGLFRWVMNVVIYATWEEPGEHWISNREARQLWERVQKLPRNSGKRAELSKKFQRLEKRERLRLGERSTVVRRTLQTSETPRLFSGQGRAERAAVRVRVAGHWKRVACGKGRQERRLTWVAPYWRNEGAAEEASPRHDLR